MTVSSETSRKSFVGDGATTSFGTSPMVFFDSADLLVYVVTTATGAATLLTENTHYTVSGGDGSTGTVSTAGGSSPFGAPSAAQTLVIVREVAITQGSDLINNDGSDAEVLEDALDRLTMIAQQHATLLDRSFTLPDSDVSGASTELPTPAASQLIGWNSGATALQNYSASSLSLALTTAFTLTLLDDTDGDAFWNTLEASITDWDLFVQDIFDGVTAETAPAVGDLILLSDVSETPDDGRKMTLENMLKVVNGLTEDTTPDTDDFLLSYDVSASGPKKVKPENLALAARKNAIINGDFNIWQRGTSFAAIASGALSADRWKWGIIGAAAHTVSRSTDVPTVAEAGRLFNYSLLADCTTADASIAAGDISYVAQFIEGYNWAPLAQRICTLSFWVKATKTGTYCVGFANSNGDRTVPLEYTINSADTWEKKTLILPASPSAGTWDYTNGIGLGIYFILAAGSNFQVAAGSWQSATTNGLATSNQVNGTDSDSNNFRICGVQLEAGSVATDFEYRTFQDELMLCERYFERSYNYGVDTGTVTTAGATLIRAASTQVAGTVSYRVPKRAAATCTLYSSGTGASGNIRNNSGGSDLAASPAASGFNTAVFDASGGTDGSQYSWQWTASAEL